VSSFTGSESPRRALKKVGGIRNFRKVSIFFPLDTDQLCEITTENRIMYSLQNAAIQ